MTLQRILTAAVLIPLVVAADLYCPTWLIAILVAVVTFLALKEFFVLGAQSGLRGHAGWTMGCSVLLVVAQYLDTYRLEKLPLLNGYLAVATPGATFHTNIVLVLFILGAVVVTLAGTTPQTEHLAALSISTSGMMFVAWPASYLVLLHAPFPWGPWLLLFLLLLIWVGDTLAYFVGRRFGRHRMAPRLSPNKTWEGAVANVAGSLLVALLAASVRSLWAAEWTRLGYANLLAMAIAGNVAGQLGDLAESSYKRSAGAKDSSSLLPGHGGILDRIDSLIFAAPVVWYYFSVIVQRHP